jgi:protein-L-isoaspartate(D-aspartate) O-methyltransferase
MTTPLTVKKVRLIMELRAEGITNAKVLGAIERVSREDFLPETFRDRAYENVALPIGHGQTISQPLVVAIMTDALEVGDRHKVLEIGTGSGYQTAVLAKLCRRVFTMERHRELLKQAEQRFAALRLHNVITRFGDGTKGWPEQSPFDRIIVTAASEEVPRLLLESLTDGGVLVIPVGEERREQELLRIRRKGDSFERESFGAVRFVPLVAGLPRETARKS